MKNPDVNNPPVPLETPADIAGTIVASVIEVAPVEVAPVAEATAKAVAAALGFIALAPGQSSPQMVPVANVGQSGLSGLYLRAGEPLSVVPDDSREPGISETLAASLVDRGLCVRVTKKSVKEGGIIGIIGNLDSSSE